MTHRESQRLAHEQIVASGLLSRLRLQVYRLVYEMQEPDGVTGGELDHAMSGELGFTRSGSPRLNELEKLGVLEEMPLRKCHITGMLVIPYRTTGRLPIAPSLPSKRVTCRSMLAVACGLLREPLPDDPQWQKRVRELLLVAGVAEPEVAR